MNRPGLNQLEEGDFSFEAPSVLSLHFEGSGHRPKRRRQRAAGSVFKTLAGLECGLLSDNARSVHFLRMARSVYDRPVSIKQLDCGLTFVRDANRVEKEPATARGAAVFRREPGADLHSDAFGLGFGSRFKEIVFRHAPDPSSDVYFGLPTYPDAEECSDELPPH